MLTLENSGNNETHNTKEYIAYFLLNNNNNKQYIGNKIMEIKTSLGVYNNLHYIVIYETYIINKILEEHLLIPGNEQLVQLTINNYIYKQTLCAIQENKTIIYILNSKTNIPLSELLKMLCKHKYKIKGILNENSHNDWGIGYTEALKLIDDNLLHI